MPFWTEHMPRLCIILLSTNKVLLKEHISCLPCFTQFPFCNIIRSMYLCGSRVALPGKLVLSPMLPFGKRNPSAMYCAIYRFTRLDGTWRLYMQLLTGILCLSAAGHLLQLYTRCPQTTLPPLTHSWGRVHIIVIRSQPATVHTLSAWINSGIFQESTLAMNCVLTWKLLNTLLAGEWWWLTIHLLSRHTRFTATRYQMQYYANEQEPLHN